MSWTKLILNRNEAYIFTISNLKKDIKKVNLYRKAQQKSINKYTFCMDHLE